MEVREGEREGKIHNGVGGKQTERGTKLDREWGRLSRERYTCILEQSFVYGSILGMGSTM